MLIIPPPMLVVVGTISTALAQVLLKRAAQFEVSTAGWLTFMALAAGSYVLSFLLFSQILKYYALNKVYPLMTVAQIILISLYGLTVGEVIGGRQALGLLLGVVAIFLILS